MNKFTLTTLIICLISGLSVQAKSKKKLRLNPEKGDIYEMTTNMNFTIDQEMMGQQIKVKQDMYMLVSMTVEDVLPNKNIVFNYSYDLFKLDMDAMGNKMSFSSDSIDEKNPAFGFLSKITKVNLKTEMTPLGEVIKIEGLEGLSESVGPNPQMAQMLKMFSDPETFKSNFSQTFNYFPKEKVSIGSTWDSSIKMAAPINMDIAMNYSVTDIKKDDVILNVESDINANTTSDEAGVKMDINIKGTQAGDMIINAKDGMLKSSNLNQEFNMKMKMNVPNQDEQMEIPMIMNSTVTITVTKK